MLLHHYKTKCIVIYNSIVYYSKYAIQMSNAIASGAEEAKMSPDTPASEGKESKESDPSIPKTGFFKHYVYIFILLLLFCRN